jgi:hypothetical protein
MAAVLAGFAPAVQQPAADRRKAGSEYQPRSQHQQVGSGHLGRPPIRALAGTSGKDSAAGRKARAASVVTV